MKETEKPEFKKFNDDPEIKHFTRQLVYTLLMQLGYEKLIVDESPTTSALALNPLDPLSNLLNLQIHVPKRKQKQSSPEIPTSESEDRRESDDSDTLKQSEP